ncbi:MAG: type II toxin-antitoxin system HicB family antitoxin [Cytophagales bacterium]|nr:type II toxin-antitoxin system HicB family antitoxin [Cytophagales bacterium]
MEDKTLLFRILITQDEDGIFVVECSNLPGCISQGNTRKEALENIQDAIKGYLDSLKKHNEAIPYPISEEIVEITL